MKELLFRAWDKINKKMIGENHNISSSPNLNVEELTIGFNGNIRYCDYEQYYPSISEEEDKTLFVIMQFIGLKDKNGKKIFERDIIKVTINSGENGFYYREVVWNNKIAGFDFGECEIMGHDNLDYEIEVVGNIFENPELVKNE